MAAFVAPGQDSPKFDTDLHRADFAFREDSFDPVTRIKRGRFYQSAGSRPSTCYYTLERPLYGKAGSVQFVPREAGPCGRELFTFQPFLYRPPQNIVAIGSKDSLWRVLGTETITTGEILVTLKARNALGVLPELNADSVPERGREKATETFERLVDSASREAPGSIVDRARDAIQWCLGTWAASKFGDEKLHQTDLSELIDRIDKRWDDKKNGKPYVILEKRSLRPLMEADAEFALAAVGFLLREFGWTR